MRIYLAVGHGNTRTGTWDPGAQSGRFIEHTLNHQVSEAYLAALQRHHGFEVKEEVNGGPGHDPDWEGSANAANAWQADWAIEIHHNASRGHAGKGVEAHVSPETSEENRQCAKAMVEYIASSTGLVKRGQKDTSAFGFLRRTRMPAILVECAFLDNPIDQRIISSDAYFERVGEALARATCELAGIRYVPPGALTPILASPRATAERAATWAGKRHGTNEFAQLASTYWRLAGDRGGVDPATAYAQAAKETAFGRFGGAVDATYRNPCGIKTRDGASHQRFASWQDGVKAHLDHLALYAGAPAYPIPVTPDPRHFHFLLGSATTVEELGGRWAPDPSYGRSIVTDYLSDLLGKRPVVPSAVKL